MGMGSTVNDGIDLIVPQNLVDVLLATNITFDKNEAGKILNSAEVVERGAVFKLVEADHFIVLAILFYHSPGEPSSASFLC